MTTELFALFPGYRTIANVFWPVTYWISPAEVEDTKHTPPRQDIPARYIVTEKLQELLRKRYGQNYTIETGPGIYRLSYGDGYEGLTEADIRSCHYQRRK